MSVENKVTSIEELKEYARGQFTELPPFAEGQPFFCETSQAVHDGSC